MAKQNPSSSQPGSSASTPAQSASASSADNGGAAASNTGTATSAAAPAATPTRSEKYGHDPVLAAGIAAMSAKAVAEESEQPASPGTDYNSDPNNAEASDDIADAVAGILTPGKKDEATSQTDKATETPAADTALLERAKAAGLTDELAADLGDDLETYLSMLGEAPAQAQAQAQTPAATPEARQPAAPATPAAPKPDDKPDNKPADKPKAEDPFASLRGKIDDDLLNTLQTAIDAKLASANQTITSLQSRLAEFDTAARSREIEQMQQQFESAFAAVEDVYKPLIGSGLTEALSPSDPAQRLRVGIAQEALAYMQAQQAIKGKAPTVQEAVRTLLIAKFPNRIRLAERNAVRSAARRSNAAAVHPANRAAPKQPANAEEALDQELRAILQSAT